MFRCVPLRPVAEAIDFGQHQHQVTSIRMTCVLIEPCRWLQNKRGGTSAG